MSVSSKTEQEIFWEGEFGNEYTERVTSDGYLASNVSLFSRVLKSTRDIDSVLELGANVGSNLQAINKLLPQANIDGVEINQKSASELQNWLSTIEAKGKCHPVSIFDFDTKKRFDLVLTKTVLIHINPDRLIDVYQKIYGLSSKYIFIGEYYNPAPVEVTYRGHRGKLFKRDFCGEMLQLYPDLRLLDYGFVYHLDQNFPQDDVNWFLLEKPKS